METHWDNIEPTPVRRGRVPVSFGQTGFVKPFLKYHTVLPSKIEDSIAQKLLLLVLELRSEYNISEALAIISNGNIQASSLLITNVNRELIEEIDEHCATVVRFVSASNWNTTYTIIKKQLNQIKATSNETPSAHVDVLSHIYLHSSAISILLKDLQLFLVPGTSSTQQALIFHFFSESLEYWAIARPSEFYKSTTENSRLYTVVTVFYDHIYSSVEHTKYFDVFLPFLSILLCLMPNTFHSSMKKKLPIPTTSKKAKLIQSLKTQLHNRKMNLKQMESMALISTIGSCLKPFNPQNPILQFVLSVRDDLSATCCNSISGLSLDDIHLFCSFFVADALTIPELCSSGIKSKLLQPDIDAMSICSLTVGLRALGSIPSANHIYMNFMKTSGAVLRKLIWKHARLLAKSRALISAQASIHSSRRSLSTSNSESVSIPILVNAYYAFIPYPSCYFDEYQAAQYKTNSFTYFEAILASLVDYDQQLVESATQFINAFTSKSHLDTFNPDEVFLDKGHFVLVIYTGCGYLVKELSNTIINSDVKDSRVPGFLRCIVRLLETRVYIGERFHLKQKCDNDITNLEHLYERQSVFNSLETALIICLCRPDVDTYKLTVKAFSEGINDALTTCNIEAAIYGCPLLYNAEQYKELSSESFVITGQVALQKRIRRILIQLAVPTDGIIDAWEILYTSLLDELETTEPATSLLTEKRNMIGLLASICDCILTSDPETNARVANLLPKVHQFFGHMVGLLNSTNLLVCDSSKEVLSREASKLSLPHTFEAIQKLIDRSIKVNDIKRNYQLFENIITLAKTTILRAVEEKFLVGNILSCLWTIAQYLDQLKDDNIHCVKLRIRACRAFQLLEKHQTDIGERISVNMYFPICSLFATWFEKSSFRSDNSSDISSISVSVSDRKLAEQESIYLDLSTESIKAAASYSKRTILEVPHSVSEDDYLQAKSSVCSRFFTIAVRGLEKYEGMNNRYNNDNVSSFIVAKTLYSTASVPSFESTSSVSKQNQRSNVISEHLIITLTNVLQKNIDVGLKFALPLGFHQLPSIRQAFINVFIGIIQKTATQVSDTTVEQRNLQVLDFLSDNLAVCVAICEVCPASDVDSLASIFLNLYESKGKGLELVKAIVTREIENTQRVVQLLRRNSVATKMLTLYAKKYGTEYLYTTLNPVLQQIINSPDEHVFELSADKIGGHESEKNDNIEKFMKCLSNFMDAITSSMDKLPQSFREICSTIQRCALQRFPEAVTTSVGAFLFLRFFCPAIVAPDTEKLLSASPRRDVRRSLLLIAKVIQNMANGSLYSLKLPLLSDKMTELNKINSDLVKFLHEAAENDTQNDLRHDFINCYSVSESNQNGAKNEEPISKTELLFLHEYLYNHWSDIQARARSFNKEDPTTRALLINRASLDPSYASMTETSTLMTIDASSFSKLDELLEALGSPRETTKIQVPKNIIDSSTHAGTGLYDFMARNASKDFGVMEESRLVRQGSSGDAYGLPYLIISAGMCDKTTVTDPDLVVYRCFQILSKIWDDKWSIMLDCTGFGPHGYFPLAIITRIQELLPPQYASNCEGFHFINVSTYFVSTVEGILETSARTDILSPYFIPYYFTCTFIEQLPVSLFGLSKRTKTIIKDTRVSFNDVYQYDDQNENGTEVDLKLCDKYIQTCKIEPVKLHVGGRIIHLRLIDIVFIGDVTQASMSNQIPNGYDLKIENSSTLHFSSSQRVDITSMLNSMILRYSDHSSSTSTTESPVVSFNDVVSTLRVVSYAGLFRDEPEVRNSAYNLKIALQKFTYSTGNRDTSSAGGEVVYFPKNDINFLLRDTEFMAKNHPEYTYEMLSAYFMSVENSMSNKKDSSIFLANFLRNVYKYVYSIDGRKGIKRTQQIIKKLLKIHDISEDHIANFHQNVWSPLFEQKELSPMIVDEVISACIDKRSQGQDCESILSILTISRTLEVTEKVIYRLINTSAIPMAFDNEAKAIANAQANWAELIVLVRACVALCFNKPESCWKYLGEICFITTSYIGFGPQIFRFALQKLIINCLHTISLDSEANLDHNKQNEVKLTVERFSGDRANLLFGITKSLGEDNEKNTLKLAFLAPGIEKLVDHLLEFMNIVGNDDQKKTWKYKWTDLVSDSAFARSSVIKPRSMIVLGVLSTDTSVDSDILVGRIVNFLEKVMDPKAIHDAQLAELRYSMFDCLIRLTDALSSMSIWWGKLFWLSTLCFQISSIDLFLISIKLSAKILQRMDELGLFVDGDVVGILSKEREIVGAKIMDEFDDFVGLVYKPDMFDNYICSFLLKGLLLSSTRHPTLKVMETFLNVRARNTTIYLSKHADKVADIPAYSLAPSPYMTFLFLFSRTHREKKNFLKNFYNETKLVPVGEGYAVPQILIDYFESGSDSSIICLYQAASVLKSPGIDDIVLIKFLRWLLYTGTKSPKHKILTYVYMRSKLEEICIQSSSFVLIQSCQGVITQVLSHRDFDYSDVNDYMKELSRIVSLHHFEHLTLNELVKSSHDLEKFADRYGSFLHRCSSLATSLAS